MKNSFYLTVLFSSLFFSFSAFANYTPIKPVLESGAALMNCGDTFFDPGGENGDFQPGDSQLVTFCPDNPDDFVTVNFTEWDLGTCCNAVLELHQGSTLGNLIFNYDASNPPITTSGFEPGCITFNFTADAGAIAAPGWEATVSCSPCSPPIGHFIEFNGVDFIDMFVFIPFFDSAILWEAGTPGFTPGNGESFISGMEFGDFFQVFGLESGTTYEIYVANICNFSDTSAYYGPITIFTMPSCGDDFFDSGGPDGDLTPNNLFTGTICPDIPGQLVEINFETFDLGSNDNVLVLFDSEFPGGNLLGEFSGTDNPGFVSATDYSGCISFELFTGVEVGPGWEATVSCITCPVPVIQSANQISSNSANISWNFVMPAQFYYYELGAPGFTPGTGSFISSGNVANATVLVPGLIGNTAYEIYVRSHCNQFDTSAFSAPLSFITSPSCGDMFYDSGGADGDYSADQTLTFTTICPNVSNSFVSLDFDTFSLSNNGGLLEIYDSEEPFINYVGTWFGNNSPGTISATNLSGCLSVLFSPQGSSGYGWEAAVECIDCPTPNNIQSNDFGQGLEISWNFVSAANSYNWEIGLPGFIPGTGNAVISNTTTQNIIFGINGLEGNTEYEFYVRTNCDNGSTSPFAGPITFISPPSCGDSYYDPGGPDEDFPPFSNDNITICPSELNTFVEIEFNELDIDPCCANMFINDGFNFIEINNNVDFPNPITSQNFDGCLTVNFSSNSDQVTSGWDATINCIACPAITQFNISRIADKNVRFNWASPDVTLSIDWEVGEKGFEPGTNSATAAGSSSFAAAEELASGLTANTEYEIYIKNNCTTESSAFIGPFHFRTAPNCGGQFFDPAGPDSSYTGLNINQLTVICPEQNGEFVEVEFQEFNTGPFFNDVLRVFNGEDTNGSFLGEVNNTPLPAIFSSTDPTGCLAFEFNAFSNQTNPGWEADVACVNCPRVAGLMASETTPHSIEIEWNILLSASQYVLELGEKGFNPGIGEALFTETVEGSTNSFVFTGLESGTFYEVYVQSDCSGEISPFSLSLLLSTQPTCGDFFFDPGGPNDQYPSNSTSVTTICPEAANQKVTVSFNLVSLETCCDFINVIDGPDLFNNWIGSVTGNFPPAPFTATHPSGCLTFEFISNNTTQGNGWEAVVSCTPSTSVEEVEREGWQLQIFPNPTTADLNLVFDYPSKESLQLEVHDIMGRKILANQFDAISGRNTASLNLSTVPTGTYLVSVRGEQGMVTEKVVRI